MKDRPTLAENLEINQMEDGYVIYQADKDRIHYLNHTAVLVLESCTGNNSVKEIARIVKEAFGLDAEPDGDVDACLANLEKEGLIF